MSMKQKTYKWILIILCITLGISCVSFAGCMSEHAVKGSDTKATTTVDEKKSSDSGDTTVTVSSDEKRTSSVAEGITTTGNTAPVSRGDSKSGTTFEINNYNDLQLFAVMVNGGEFNGTTYISDPTLNAVLTKSFVHHKNKKDEDGYNSISGSNGLAGVCDDIYELKRKDREKDRNTKTLMNYPCI